jgi:hypothetical protein
VTEQDMLEETGLDKSQVLLIQSSHETTKRGMYLVLALFLISLTAIIFVAQFGLAIGISVAGLVAIAINAIARITTAHLRFASPDKQSFDKK